MAEVLSVRDVHAGFDGRDVLRGLSFSLDDGEVLTVVGPNGSGKTTLVKAILGLVPVKAGEIRIFGKGIGDVDAERLIAYIPQRMEVDRTFPISLREMLSLSLPKAKIEKYAGMFEIEGLLGKMIGELSGGEFQRALLAYALVKEPRFLIMDEPATWVDVKGADCILCIVEELRDKGISVVYVSHDIGVARSISTKILGLGHEGYFMERRESPLLEGRLSELFGTKHHGLCGPGGPRA